LCCALFLAAIEGFDVGNSYLFMAGLLCGIEDPLTPVAPDTDIGNFFAALCSVIELAVGGAIVGILGGHSKMQELVIMLEGQPEAKEEVKADIQTPAEMDSQAPCDPKQNIDSMNDMDLIVHFKAMSKEGQVQKSTICNSVPDTDMDPSSQLASTNESVKRFEEASIKDSAEIARLKQLLTEAEEARIKDLAEIQRLRAFLQERETQVETASTQHRAEVQKLQEQIKEGTHSMSKEERIVEKTVTTISQKQTPGRVVPERMKELDRQHVLLHGELQEHQARMSELEALLQFERKNCAALRMKVAQLQLACPADAAHR